MIITYDQWRRQVLQVGGANIWGPVDGGTEGPERGAEARSAGAPRGVGPGEGRRDVEIAILGHFCKLKWSFVKWRQGRIRQ